MYKRQPPDEVGTSPQEYGSTCAIVRTGPRVLVSFMFRDVRPWGLRTDPGRETGARADTFDDGKKEDWAARRGLLFPAVRRRPDATAVATRAAVIPAGDGGDAGYIIGQSVDHRAKDRVARARMRAGRRL